MSTSYRAQVAIAFEVLAAGLAPFVDARMSATFPAEDWIPMAATKLGKRRDVLVSLSDPHFQLEVINRWWGPAFAEVLTSDLRQTVTDLRTARNHWAHPDEDHPLDLDYATRVHHAGEDLLRAIDSPQAEAMAAAAEQLRWDGVRDVARDKGMSEQDAMILQLGDLQTQYDDLQHQLEQARITAQSAAGRSRAFARQLAELQTQYAAVSGLRDDYLALQHQLEDEKTKRGGLLDDTGSVREQLSAAESALSGLQNESAMLREQLDAARRSSADIDPLETVEGRRWIWLITALVLVLGLLVALAAFFPH